jgi:hypothetical protein
MRGEAEDDDEDKDDDDDCEGDGTDENAGCRAAEDDDEEADNDDAPSRSSTGCRGVRAYGGVCALGET